MGNSRKIRKKYANPRHPWQRSRLEAEKVWVRDFGLKNKKEVYRHNSMIKGIIRRFKNLNYQTTEQAQIEKAQLFERVVKLGLLKADQKPIEILNLTVIDALNRRLQTIVFKKGLARTITQARQFIVHKHILINDTVIDVPSYVVPVSQENVLSFRVTSPLFTTEHPERITKAASEAAKQKAKADASQEAEVIEIKIDDEEIVEGEQ